MGTPVLILGDSGAGKSYSLRNFTPDEVIYCNAFRRCCHSALPAGSSTGKSCRMALCSVETSSGLMPGMRCWTPLTAWCFRRQDAYWLSTIPGRHAARKHDARIPDRVSEVTEMADHVWQIIMAATRLPDDFRVYFLAHTEESDGKIRMKTTGKMLNEKLTPEGYFSIVLRAIKKDGNTFF
nr:ATP-binding protein [Klebsiella aerogenes]